MSPSASASAPDPSDANADVATRLEAGQVPLEEALTLWERGEALAARCQAWLDDARTRLAAVAEHENAPS